MNESKTHRVTVTRDGQWWMVAIPELDGLTQASSLDDAEQTAREWIAVTLDVPIESVLVSIDRGSSNAPA